MSGPPIDELNAGIQIFLNEVKSDDLARWSVDLAIYTAGGLANCIQSFTGIEQIERIPSLYASGGTPLGQATKMALDDINSRKEKYRATGVPYYQPWLVLISDGEPTDAWIDAAQRARTLSSQRKLVSLPIGVQGANLGILSDFSNKPAVALDGLKFCELFQWLSASMARVSASTSSDASVKLPSISNWGNI